MIKDTWLLRSLIYYKVIDKNLAQQLISQAPDDTYFYDILTRANYLKKSEIHAFIKIALQIKVLDLSKTVLSPDIIKIVPQDFCEKHKVLPLKLTDKKIFVAFANPFDLDTDNEIERLTGRYVVKYFAPVRRIEEAINIYYNPENIIAKLLPKGGILKDIKFDNDQAVDSVSPVVKLVNKLVVDAVQKGASDIHIEPGEQNVQIRFRVDGILRNQLELVHTLYTSIISRVKIVSNLNIAESRKPQDGKARVHIGNNAIDLRVSTMPTHYGEKVVIRILDKRKTSIDLQELGVNPSNLIHIKNSLAQRQGLFLVTGPTGAGKSTTLYAALNFLRNSTRNIVTIEDPIEYMLDGINQVQVNEKAGITFDSALKSFLRQDPDVIMVGEIRDKQTADIAVQASLTGHLVMSTMHTNDALTAINRLLDMGVDRYRISDALNVVIAQRLLRRLCNKCKTRVNEADVNPRLIDFFKKANNPYSLYSAKGCVNCDYSGYKGRVGIYEVLLLDEELKEMVGSHAALSTMRKAARRGGFRTLFYEAIQLVAGGITDYNEVVRAVNPPVKKVEPAKAKSANKTVKTDKPGSNHSILITDDSPQTRGMVRTVLEKMGSYRVLEASDGVKALELLKKEQPDLMITDLMMPNMDGYDLLQEIRSDEEYCALPVLVFSAFKTPNSEQKVIEMGADGYLVKPIEPKQLLKMVEQKLFKQEESGNPDDEVQPFKGTDEGLKLKLV